MQTNIEWRNNDKITLLLHTQHTGFKRNDDDIHRDNIFPKIKGEISKYIFINTIFMILSLTSKKNYKMSNATVIVLTTM